MWGATEPWIEVAKDVATIAGGLAHIVLLIALWRWLRGPIMISFKLDKQKQWVRDLFENDGAVSIINYDRQDYIFDGYAPVRRGWLRREVHADRKGEGEYALLMAPKRKWWYARALAWMRRL